MFIDLDRLKPLNDQLGHEAGDAALILTSTILRRMVRPSDLVARLGGDEFALWLDGFDGLTAAERAEHLRLTFPLEAAEFALPGQQGLTMSIGIACRQPGEGEELEDIIQRADLAMYEVKRDGGGHWRGLQYRAAGVTRLDHALPPAEAPPEDRVRQAARPDSPPAALRELARDPDIIVRATVAMSSRADAELDTILASDGDERVRALLAARIARLLSTSNLAVQGEWAEHIDRTLRALAADEAVRVRAAVADELAQTLAAPRDLVLQLAHDASREVSDRVIRLSPLLSDGDLLSILACAPCASVAASIANRDHLSAVVADAIADQAECTDYSGAARQPVRLYPRGHS